MKKRLSALLLTGLMASVAMADDLADFKKWYIAESPKAVKAMENKDLKFFENSSSPNFTYTTADGKVSKKKEAMAGLKGMFDSMKTIKYTFEMGKFKAEKGVFTVELSNHYKMTMDGPDKKVHTMTMDQKTIETFAKVKGKWIIQGIKDVGPAKGTMDGKPFDPNKMGGG